MSTADIRLSGSVQVPRLACTGGQPQLADRENGDTSYPSAWPSAGVSKLPSGWFLHLPRVRGAVGGVLAGATRAVITCLLAHLGP